MGLEHGHISSKRIQFGYAVIIPYSGLRTVEEYSLKDLLRMSPSHPVGLELISELLECLWDIFKSPSHTVGSEQVVSIAAKLAARKSPSHPVGSEHFGKN